MKSLLLTLFLSLMLSIPASAQEYSTDDRYHDKGVNLGNMTEEDLFYWEIQKDKPVFGHACAMALAGGEFKEKDEIKDLCEKVRNAPQIEEAIAVANNAMKSMSEGSRNRLLNGEAPIGAPKAAVYLAWGKPKNTKRTITEDMVAEQIIYDSRIVYIENGILTMIQE